MLLYRVVKQTRTQRDHRSRVRRTAQSAIRRAEAGGVGEGAGEAAVHPGRFNGTQHLAITIRANTACVYVGLVTCDHALGRANICVTPADATYYTVWKLYRPCFAGRVACQCRATDLWVQNNDHRVVFDTHIYRIGNAW